MVRLAVVYADFELKYFWYADFHPKKMPKMMCMLTSATPPSRPPSNKWPLIVAWPMYSTTAAAKHA